MNILEGPLLAHHTISLCFTLHWMATLCLRVEHSTSGVKAKKQVRLPREETSARFEVTEQTPRTPSSSGTALNSKRRECVQRRESVQGTAMCQSPTSSYFMLPKACLWPHPCEVWHAENWRCACPTDTGIWQNRGGHTESESCSPTGQ